MTVLAGQFSRALNRRVHSHTQPRQPRQQPWPPQPPLRGTRHDRHAGQRRYASTNPPTGAQKLTVTSVSKPIAAPSKPPQPKSLPAPGPPKDDPIPIANNVSTLPLWQRLGPLTRAADGYARAQRRRPYATQLCSSLVIALCADLSVQRMMAKGDPAETEAESVPVSPSGLSSTSGSPDPPVSYSYDPMRTLRSMTIGAISSIPTYRWFMFLSHSFNYSSHILSLAIKVVVNQLCFTPVFNSYFFSMQALLAGETPREAFNRVCRTVPISFVNSVKLWPAVTAFSFTFVPMEYRSVFSGVIAVGWQTYLVYLNRQAELQEQKRLRALVTAETGEAAATTASEVSSVLSVSSVSSEATA